MGEIKFVFKQLPTDNLFAFALFTFLCKKQEKIIATSMLV